MCTYLLVKQVYICLILQEELSLENVHDDLKKVVDDGVFRFKEGQDMSVDMCLEFHSDDKTIEWPIEEVNSFEQKLGLIDDKTSDGEDIQAIIGQFLEASEVSI